MDKKFKKAWLKALRSGDFKQITGRLHRKTGYCCLGVACEVANKKFGLDLVGRYDTQMGCYTYNGYLSTLPHSVVKLANLPTGTTTKLANMNDSGSTFEEIADYIEEHM